MVFFFFMFYYFYFWGHGKARDPNLKPSRPKFENLYTTCSASGVEVCGILQESIWILTKDLDIICEFCWDCSIEKVCSTLYFTKIYLGFFQICWGESLQEWTLRFWPCAELFSLWSSEIVTELYHTCTYRNLKPAVLHGQIHEGFDGVQKQRGPTCLQDKTMSTNKQATLTVRREQKQIQH